jgi:hypothetical protein
MSSGYKQVLGSPCQLLNDMENTLGWAVYRYFKYIDIFSNEIWNEMLSSTLIKLISVESTAHLLLKKPF